MDTFQKAFNRTRRPNDKKRTFSNMFSGLGTGYVVYYQTAINDYQNKNLQGALANINKAIDKADINDWKHYAFRANVYEDLRDFKQAIADYQQAIEFAQSDIDVYAIYHQIGFCYLNQGNNQKALEFYNYAIDLKKQHPNGEFNPDQEGMDGGVMVGLPFKRMYNNRANSNFNLGNLNEALEDCKKAIGYDKNYSNPYLLVAQIYSKAGQEQQALHFLKVAAQLGNRNAASMLQQLGY